jgi:hypothetical protein
MMSIGISLSIFTTSVSVLKLGGDVTTRNNWIWDGNLCHVTVEMSVPIHIWDGIRDEIISSKFRCRKLVGTEKKLRHSLGIESGT